MLDPLYHLAANAIVFFHKGLGPIFGHDSFFSWAFSVVLLVVCVRILIFPLFKKQVKSQRKMQQLNPLIKEIREKHKNNKQRMQEEIMALQREHGNPLLGCLPILLQIPLFISLFHVFNSIRPASLPGGGFHYVGRSGLSADQVGQIAEAKLFGVSLSSSFTSSKAVLDFIGANGTAVKIFAVVLIVLMGTTTFLTQKQIMGRAGPVDQQQQMIQRVLLYVSPVMLAVFGFRFPIAVLVYWLTTNLWSMGQQFFVIRRMPPIVPLGPGGRPARSGPPPGGKPGRQAGVSMSKDGKKGGGTPPPLPGKGTNPRAAVARGKAPVVGTARSARTAAGKTSAARNGGGATGTSAANGTAGGSAADSTATGGASGGTAKQRPADTAASATSGPDANGQGPAAGTSTPSGTGKTGSGSGSSKAGDESSGGSRPAVPTPAGAGVPGRRTPGGSRPAKKRSKGQRRGGRH